jgi:hypothetical protein
MNITLNPDCTPSVKPPTFPVLKKWNGYDKKVVVLFVSEYQGIRLTEHEGRQIGEFEEWISCFDSDWVDYTGSVTFKN